tara:strand:+ start:779 stop:1705 length:927 start_codon:yes stop_codon:yes gene_type:complete
MSILFHCTFDNSNEWKRKIKKKFKNKDIISIHDKSKFNSVEIAIIWNLPNNVLSKLPNLKIIFSLGAGVDHILKLEDYNGKPIVRIKDPLMGELMYYYVLSQILNFQVGINEYKNAQSNKLWSKEILPKFNKDLTVGILGLGYLGSIVGKLLARNQYNIIGYKKTKIKKQKFKMYYGKQLSSFIKSSDILINLLPNTKDTINFIDIKFLSLMKKKSLLISAGRGSTVNENDLIKYLKINKYFYAALDVFHSEPLSKKSLLWSLPNVNITPHVASITLVDSAIDLIFTRYIKYLNTKKIQPDVNLKKGY